MVIGFLGLGVATYIAFVIIFLVVAALAGYLILVAYLLNKTSFVLGTVLIGVRSIAYQTEPLGEVVAGITSDIAAIQAALRALLPASSSRRPMARLARGRARPRTDTRA